MIYPKTTNGRSGLQRMIVGSVASKMMQASSKPILLLKPTSEWRSRVTGFKRLLVALDGSTYSERVLPYVRLLAQHFGSDVILLTVPMGLDSESYQDQIRNYLLKVSDELRQDGIRASIQVTGSGPARTIVRVGQDEMADLIMLATQGRGGVDRMMVGSVADRVIQNMPCPVFLVPINKS